MSLKQSNQLFW